MPPQLSSPARPAPASEPTAATCPAFRSRHHPPPPLPAPVLRGVCHRQIEGMDGGSLTSNASSSESDEVDFLNENIDGNEVLTPEIGMKFKSVEDMFQCFKKFAKYKGFAARKQSSKKNKDGFLRSVTFTCSRSGQPKSTKSVGLVAYPTNETGCKVKLTSSCTGDGLWRINKLILEHNHDLSPSKAWLFRCYRNIDEHVKKQLEFGDIAGIGQKKSYNQLVIEAGGHEHYTFVEKDCRNHIEKARRLRLGEGDSVAIQNYFLKMQAQNSDFFFSMDFFLSFLYLRMYYL